MTHRTTSSTSTPQAVAAPSGFAPGEIIVIWLGSPREQYWGLLLELSPAGLTMRGLPLHSLEDHARRLRDGEHLTASKFFLPMHRVERMEADASCEGAASLRDQFTSLSGRAAEDYLRGEAR